MTPQELIQIAKQKGIDTSKYEAKLSGQAAPQSVAQAPVAPQATPKANLASALTGLGADKLLQPQRNPLQVLGAGIGAYATGKPEDLSGTSVNALDSQLKLSRIKAMEAGMTTDAEGNVIRTTDVARDEREKRLQDFESRKTGTTLRTELSGRPYVKSFQETNMAAQRIDGALQDYLTRQDPQSLQFLDQTLIFGLSKMLDPESVVMVSEYARSVEGQSLLNRLSGYFDKLQKGGAGLTPQDRLEIGRMSKILMNEAGNLYNAEVDRYDQLTSSYAVPRDLVMTGFDRFSPYQVGGQSSANPNGAPPSPGIPVEAQAMTPISPTPQNTDQSAQFNSPEEADASGLPAGTIVMVKGRRYQIG